MTNEVDLHLAASPELMTAYSVSLCQCSTCVSMPGPCDRPCILHTCSVKDERGLLYPLM